MFGVATNNLRRKRREDKEKERGKEVKNDLFFSCSNFPLDFGFGMMSTERKIREIVKGEETREQRATTTILFTLHLLKFRAVPIDMG